MRVLVTDGHLKAALSVVRALGRLGVEVHTTQSRHGSTLGSLSAFTRSSHVLMAPESGPGFDAQLLDLLGSQRFDYLVATSETTLQRISLNRERIGELTRVDLPPRDSLDLVLSKVGLLEFARQAQVPTPRTVVYSESMTAGDIARALEFPMVAKTFWGDIYDRVKYINSLQELTSYLAEPEPLPDGLFSGVHPRDWVRFLLFLREGQGAPVAHAREDLGVSDYGRAQCLRENR